MSFEDHASQQRRAEELNRVCKEVVGLVPSIYSGDKIPNAVLRRADQNNVPLFGEGAEARRTELFLQGYAPYGDDFAIQVERGLKSAYPVDFDIKYRDGVEALKASARTHVPAVPSPRVQASHGIEQRRLGELPGIGDGVSI